MTIVMLQHTLTLRLTDVLKVPQETYAHNIPPNSYNINNINFNPQPPKDPARIYRKNGFLSSTTTKKPIITYIQEFENNNDNNNNNNLNHNSDNRFSFEIIPSISPNPFFKQINRTTTPINVYDDNGRFSLDLTPPKENKESPYKDNPFIYPTKQIETTTIRVEKNLEDQWLNKQPFGNICGRLGSVSLVANGQDVLPGMYPWLVAIYETKAEGLVFNCGGTLISNRHVISGKETLCPRN